MFQAVSVAIMEWSFKQCVYYVQTLFSNGSVICVWLAFNIVTRSRIPDQILAQGLRIPGYRKCVHDKKGLSEYCHYPRKHQELHLNYLPGIQFGNRLDTLGISFNESSFALYKMVFIQELQPLGFEGRRLTSENKVAALPQDTIVFFFDVAHSHLSG